MDLLNNLAAGFATALSWANLLYALGGTLIGTLIGVLPGLGPLVTIAMLLPVTYGLEPTSALILLAGIYYGSQYGGSTTAILVNIPGESSSAVTLLEGHQMARTGRAGPVLAGAAMGSFFAGCVGTLLLAAFAGPLASLALQFGSPEYFALIWGLVASMWIGNLMLVVLNLPLVGVWVSLLKVPYRLLFPAILAFCAIGVFSLQNAAFDIYQLVAFGVLGCFLAYVGAPAVSLLLGFVMGPMLEENFRRSLLLSDGHLSIFTQRPLSLGLLLAAAALLLAIALPGLRRRRRLIGDEALT
ncbi:tripartite tricarboxylate transporter permease [Acidovorax sp. CCYZU-2555]|uniref:tripartite tricarboxylate transporter permease n=1 Tax=Acidovorax sp. CCYZU-2555 TaxID=2835042 RepID=UPI001BCC45B9|nr:tripartite tricarboxylate transporter permease [Acidovorax sp. CCYZU-2555]MBS7781028.1 tripartite tricarboxylate transporter permease [Acidovorax sp. CCYZU-2555]